MEGVEIFIQALSKQRVELQKAVTYAKRTKPLPFFITNVHLITINMNANFDGFSKYQEKTKSYGRTNRRTERRTFTWIDSYETDYFFLTKCLLK